MCYIWDEQSIKLILVVMLEIETWGTRWLAKEREAEEASINISSAWMKIAFKDAVESIYRFRRWLKGRSWPATRGSAVWYKLLCDKLKKKVSKDEEDEREVREDKRRRGNPPDEETHQYRGFKGTGGGRGGITWASSEGAGAGGARTAARSIT
jgi:hypothetical protein